MSLFRSPFSGVTRLPGFSSVRPPISDFLLVGWGALDRQDESIAWYVILEMARILGRTIPVDPLAGFTSYGQQADILFLPALKQEVAETLPGYRRVCFIGSHRETSLPELIWSPLTPDPSLAANQPLAKPATCLTIAKHLYGKCPAAWLLSIRGVSFEGSGGLSNEARLLVPRATEKLLEWLQEDNYR